MFEDQLAVAMLDLFILLLQEVKFIIKKVSTFLIGNYQNVHRCYIKISLSSVFKLFWLIYCLTLCRLERTIDI